jgi:hypothetical protein
MTRSRPVQVLAAMLSHCCTIDVMVIRTDHKYRWQYWPIRVRWEKDSRLARTFWRQVVQAVESFYWTMDWPHRFADEESLRTHKRAARRFWHGWAGDHAGLKDKYCWTLHLGRLKVLFGK